MFALYGSCYITKDKSLLWIYYYVTLSYPIINKTCLVSKAGVQLLTGTQWSRELTPVQPCWKYLLSFNQMLRKSDLGHTFLFLVFSVSVCRAMGFVLTSSKMKWAVPVLTKYCILSQGGGRVLVLSTGAKPGSANSAPLSSPQGLSLGILSFAGDKEIREEICRGLLPGKWDFRHALRARSLCPPYPEAWAQWFGNSGCGGGTWRQPPWVGTWGGEFLGRTIISFTLCLPFDPVGSFSTRLTCWDT